ncbi:LAFE_0G14708g1_1 [Lachancea fermentati]|uniref:LAFE_0G14708g1_1 n=1 Tax=Lachancea fermentati TaxID=4955 RepID=A0A1G4MIC8_LACFM|nr:LAFE_0G14708g1_1 [Lachancea fermentati]
MLKIAPALMRRYIDGFSPFWFVTVMGTGISSDILHSFPYEAYWLRICSYIMFAIACLLFLTLLAICIANLVTTVKRNSLTAYCEKFFLDSTHNVFWGTFPMGLITILNFIFQLCSRELKGTISADRLIRTIYVLWWFDLVVSLGTAWGVTFLIWKSFHGADCSPHDCIQTKVMREKLQSVLLLPIVPLVVVCSSGSLFVMSDLFTKNMTRNIQLVTLVIIAMVWLHALLLVVFITTIYFWNLYVNKIPKITAIFSMFLVIGPLGQGSFGILLLTDDVKLYTEQYYRLDLSDFDSRVIQVAVTWSFKVAGVVLSLMLISTGIFFTIITLMSIASYVHSKDSDIKIHKFHKGWWAMTFPLGTMALGTNEFYKQYNPYVPLSAFRVVSAIYSVLCIGSTITCLIGTLYIAKQTAHDESNKIKSSASSACCK